MINKKRSLVIAVDGVSASGKGSLSRLIATEFNLDYLETGLLYRFVGCMVIKNNINLDDSNEIINIAKSIKLNDINYINLNNEKIAEVASIVASIKEVREVLLDIQRNFANNPPNKIGAILDGRDIGTIICPNADLKFFITAQFEVRVKRRYDQVTKVNPNETLEDIRSAIKTRDSRDKKLNDLALNDPSYIIIDNSENTLLQSFNLMKKYIIKIF